MNRGRESTIFATLIFVRILCQSTEEQSIFPEKMQTDIS